MPLVCRERSLHKAGVPCLVTPVTPQGWCAVPGHSSGLPGDPEEWLRHACGWGHDASNPLPNTPLPPCFPPTLFIPQMDGMRHSNNSHNVSHRSNRKN